MSLSPAQQRIAGLLYTLAVKQGIPAARAREVVAASYAESGLNPQAVNKQSGAAGLFQLLSPGYRQKAQAAGGLYDPAANAAAILPDYAAFFRSHPDALPGQAGAAVERSGEGAGFYARPLALLGGLAAGRATPPSSLPAATPDVQQAMDGQAARRAFTLALLQPQGFTPAGLLGAFQARRAASEPPGPVSGPQAANGGPTQPVTAGHDGSAKPHDHGATLAWLRSFTKPYRLVVTSTTDGKHAENSYHYVKRAIDESGSPVEMARLAEQALQRPHDFVEMFYTGPGNPGAFIKDGQVYPNAQLDPGIAAEHKTHVHLAR